MPIACAFMPELFATIDALTTENATLKAEIEGYRQALEAVEGALRLSKPSLLHQSLSNLVRGALERKNG